MFHVTLECVFNYQVINHRPFISVVLSLLIPPPPPPPPQWFSGSGDSALSSEFSLGLASGSGTSFGADSGSGLDPDLGSLSSPGHRSILVWGSGQVCETPLAAWECANMLTR